MMTVKKMLLITLIGANSIVFADMPMVSESQQKWVKIYKKQVAKQFLLPEAQDMLINTDAEPDLEKGFTSLFDGKTLNGWEPRGGRHTFEVIDGVIQGTCLRGSPSTYLCTTKEDYADFVFTAEIKWEIDGNTGVIFRGQVLPAKKRYVTVFGPQLEMEQASKERFWSGGIYAQSCGGWAYPLWLEAHEEVRSSVDYKGWNRVTIQSVGKTTKTWVNGIPAAHWVNEEHLKGFFGLQIHAGKQGLIHFRNIKVKEL